MKFKLIINHIILGLLAIIVITVLFKVNQSAIKNERKQEISSDGLEISSIKEMNITAKRFSFSPNPIKLKLNEKVRLKITSADVIHGFSVPELGIDEIIEPGKETVFEFTPTKRGKFILLCSVQCGVGHTGMKSSITVE